MAKIKKHPTTQAIRVLKDNNIPYILHSYTYEEHGGTSVSARELNVDEHHVIKTLVMEDETKKPLVILMHGDNEVSIKNLARFLGVKTISPCKPQTAQKHTGYLVGGTSPFGTKKTLKIYMESTIVSLDKIYINAGKRGLLAEISPKDMVDFLEPVPLEVAL
jgi:Cys-tRNA(Pro) deacylase